MPLATLRLQVTERFHEVDTYLSGIASLESADPRIPDSIDVRIMRGLFFVHLYGAFEYAIDQSFIRLAQHISTHPVLLRHLEKAIFSVSLDSTFRSIHDLTDWRKKFPRRVELIAQMGAASSAAIPDTVLSEGMTSLTSATISVAFQVYGLKGSPFVDPSAGQYINEVFERRCAVAHGRESPVTVGVKRTSELRRRYDALYTQSVYVMDQLEQFMSRRGFVASRHRSKYIA
jgi:hypothetical protein